MSGCFPGQFHAFPHVRLVQHLHVFVRVRVTDVHVRMVVKVHRPMPHRFHGDFRLHFLFRPAHRQRNIRDLVHRQGGRQHDFHFRRVLRIDTEGRSLLQFLVRHIHTDFAFQFGAFQPHGNDTSRRTVLSIPIQRLHHTTDLFRHDIGTCLSGRQNRQHPTKKNSFHHID